MRSPGPGNCMESIPFRAFLWKHRATNGSGARMLAKGVAAIAALSMLLVQPAPLVAADEVAGAKHVYVMRHLQKAAGEDPPLTEEGALLARMLGAMFGGSGFGIKAVFATHTRRAMQTGEPLARFAGVAVRPYDPRDVPALVAAVRAVKGNVLIVGHSNTVPDLVAAFGGAKPPPLSESDYGTIYQVSLSSGQVREFYVPPPPRTLSQGAERGR